MLRKRLDSLFSNWKSSKNRNQGQLDLFLISVDMKGNNIICIRYQLSEFRDLSGSCRKKHQHLWFFHCLLRHDHRCSNFDWISDCHSGGKKNRTKSGRLSGYGNCRSDRRNCGCKNLLRDFLLGLYKDNLLSIFNLREGGLAIYGGVIGAVSAVFVMAAVKKNHHFRFWIQLHWRF